MQNAVYFTDKPYTEDSSVEYTPKHGFGLMLMHEDGCNELIPQTSGSAGIDLVSEETALVEFGKVTVFSTKIRSVIPRGFCGMVCSRSGLAAKRGIMVVNAPGIIDSDYKDEIKVILTKVTDDYESCVIERGDRIAQLVFVPVATSGLDAEYSKTREGGLGSTGVSS